MVHSFSDTGPTSPSTTSEPDAPIAVLHVDDDPDFAAMAAEFLERETDTIDVTTVTTPEDALDSLAGGTFECVLSDFDMPDMNGLDLFEAVREIDPALPFILYTGKGSEEIASDAISAGVTDYIQKDPGAEHYELLARRIVNAAQQYRATEAADRAERRLLAIANNSNDVQWMFSAAWDEVLFINDAYEAVWGRPIGALTADPRDFLQGVHPDDRGRVEAAMERLSNGESVDLEVRVNERADFRRWVWIEGEPITDETGEVTRVVGFARDVTDRKRREEDLVFFEQLVEHAGVGVAAYDETGRYHYVNPGLAAMFGVDPSDIEGRYVWDVVAGTDRASFEAYWAALDIDETRTDEVVFEFDGVRVPVETVTTCREINGRRYHFGTARDVSDRLERERALERERDRFTGVFDTLPEPAVHVGFEDGEPIVRHVNEAFETVFGHSNEAAAGASLDDLIVPDRLAEEAARINRAAMDGDVITREVRRETADGERDFRFTAKRMGETETFEEGVATYVDITERKARERELERYETILDATGDPVYTIDDGGRFTYANGALLDMLGYREEELLGEPASLVMSEADVETGERLIRSLLASDRTRGIFEMDLIAADGTRIPCENHVALLPFEEDFRGTVGVLRDISERRERERRLREQNERLEQFASIVSHDLRNPLNVAQGRLELAMEGRRDDHLEVVTDAHERMRSLIDDLLTLAQGNDMLTETTSADLGAMAEACWRNVDTADASLVVDTDRTVIADEGRLQQLLENLIRNAVEHGGPDVTVTVGTLDDGFYVEDDGPGIPESDREDVFESGYTTAPDGTGFGLAIVAEIADAHGWTVRLTERPAGGARFEFTGVSTGP